MTKIIYTEEHENSKGKWVKSTRTKTYNTPDIGAACRRFYAERLNDTGTIIGVRRY